ncbi:hypothetical protein QBC37DRAFT_153334 [Rhypophila decipiens]|uniref:Uncharacterized protein n=1 Tax=Rhypophila decipiens TaxID=261697 RepID=A0AAN6YIU0_9PEZI|nr:hypothetical protein QBC37DRAFT_153334 [Rhypophila decipiens]
MSLLIGKCRQDYERGLYPSPFGSCYIQVATCKSSMCSPRTSKVRPLISHHWSVPSVVESPFVVQSRLQLYKHECRGAFPTARGISGAPRSAVWPSGVSLPLPPTAPAHRRRRALESTRVRARAEPLPPHPPNSLEKSFESFPEGPSAMSGGAWSFCLLRTFFPCSSNQDEIPIVTIQGRVRARKTCIAMLRKYIFAIFM